MDLLETPDRFIIMADIPGVDPGEIEVTMEEGTLTIQGERAAAAPTGSEATRRERPSGRFYRRFSLPETVDPQGVSASGGHGVLEVVVCKLEPVKPTGIEVQG
ncbi:MAG: Hsp20/alpha crystallin family protein [Gammaproteobacteria bacterium]|nr:Hsp20/alpha crystallin family protein [Gammaproteobacteria bacterium]